MKSFGSETPYKSAVRLQRNIQIPALFIRDIEIFNFSWPNSSALNCHIGKVKGSEAKVTIGTDSSLIASFDETESGCKVSSTLFQCLKSDFNKYFKDFIPCNGVKVVLVRTGKIF